MYSQTQITREGLEKGPSLWNGKPYRTKSQKALARKTAERREDGAWRSIAPKSYHPQPKGEQGR